MFTLFQVLSISASTYINNTLSYEIELFDTTCNQTQNINHELVFMGVAQGSLQCLQVCSILILMLYKVVKLRKEI